MVPPDVPPYGPPLVCPDEPLLAPPDVPPLVCPDDPDVLPDVPPLVCPDDPDVPPLVSPDVPELCPGEPELDVLICRVSGVSEGRESQCSLLPGQ